MIGIVCSRADEASEHVCEHVLELGEFSEQWDDERADGDGGGTFHRSPDFELRSFDELHLDLEHVASAFEAPEYVVFASRHSGETGPLLSAHPTGNFGPATYGGNPGELATAPPFALATVLDRLAVHAPPEYDVGLECTHHGPSAVGAPGMFVEVGSGPEEWGDPDGARAVARAILDLADVPPHAPPADDAEDGSRTHRHLVGFGGGHYAPRFTRIARETDWAVGHVAADWALGELGDPDAERAVVAAAFERSRASMCVIEGERPDLERVLSGLGFRVVEETWVRETSGVGLELVEAVEERLASVASGLRFGEPARTASPPDPEECSVVTLPAELFARAQGIDRESVVDAVAAIAVAFETDEGGTRIGSRVLVPGEEIPTRLIERVAEVLQQRYDDVTVEADRVVAEETTFDPELAREAGVPEGPAFGRLADGESVEVDGATVRPAAVRTRRRDVFDR